MSALKVHKVGIIMNGVTGRMGTNQHLRRSILPIMQQGGVKISDEEWIMPDPILVGRDPHKLARLASETGIEKWTTDLRPALAEEQNTVYFDAQVTTRRYSAVREAIETGKHVYCEKPSARSSEEALHLHRLAEDAGVKHGIVQDKLWLPGIQKLRLLKDTGFFGTIHSVRGEFGYWAFEGDGVPLQRPSWNFRKDDGGGIILDMFCHWQYVLENLFGRVQSLSCRGATHVTERWDEHGKRYACTADDAAYATFELDHGIVAHINSSWAARVRRDDLLTLQVDGSRGTAVAGLRSCYVQGHAFTPRPVWNPDVDSPINYYDNWVPVPDYDTHQNAFKVQWELFLKHVVCDTPFPWSLLEGAKGVQLAELGYQSWKDKAWLSVPPLLP